MTPLALPTVAAAAYCGCSPVALRKAAYRGKVRPIGRRGGTGPRQVIERRAEHDTVCIPRHTVCGDVEVGEVVVRCDCGQLRANGRPCRYVNPDLSFTGRSRAVSTSLLGRRRT